MLAIITALIVGLLSWLIKLVFEWAGSTYHGMFFNAMAVETSFYDVIDGGLFNISKLYSAVYTFAIALLIMFFVKKLAETYFAWSNRRSRDFTFFSFDRIFKSSYNYDLFWIYLSRICKYFL